MGTRARVTFFAEDPKREGVFEPVISLCRHFDGFPKDIIESLKDTCPIQKQEDAWRLEEWVNNLIATRISRVGDRAGQPVARQDYVISLSEPNDLSYKYEVIIDDDGITVDWELGPYGSAEHCNIAGSEPNDANNPTIWEQDFRSFGEEAA